MPHVIQHHVRRNTTEGQLTCCLLFVEVGQRERPHLPLNSSLQLLLTAGCTLHGDTWGPTGRHSMLGLSQHISFHT